MKVLLILIVIFSQNVFPRGLLPDRPPAARISGDIFREGSPDKKSVAAAVLYSILLPGMGELYAGDYSTGKYFTIAEAGLWLTMGAYQWYATGLRDDSRQFAVQHAGLSLNGKSDKYFVDIGEFRDIYLYNEQILRKREPQKVYDPAVGYWKWDTDANRESYRLLRVASDERFNDMKFLAAAIGINHIISAVNAARIAIAHNNNLDGTASFDIHAGVLGSPFNPSGIIISVSRNF